MTSTKTICGIFSKKPESKTGEETPHPHSGGVYMIYNYTAVISEDNGTYYAKVPDIAGCITTGHSLTEAISLITDALNLSLVVLEDEDIKPHEPTPQSDIPHQNGDIFTIIQADTIKYRSLTDTKAVRKNVSLPAWMLKQADKRGINCSKLLQDALLSVLS